MWYRKTTVLCCLFAVYGCAAGNKILKEPESFEPKQPIGLWSDSVIAVALDWIVVRDGPGTWATNANWDQYIFRIENLSGSTVSITNVHLVDLMGRKVTPIADRGRLVAESQVAMNGYEKFQLNIEEGAGSSVMEAAVVGGGVIAGGIMLSGTVAAAAGALPWAGAGASYTIIGPLVAAAAPVALTVRSRNRGEVDRKIKELHSYLPQSMESRDLQRFDLFFPISPSPQKVIVEYLDSAGSNRAIELDTSVVLKGLHLLRPKRSLEPVSPSVTAQ